MKKVDDNLTDSRVEENEYNLNYFIFDTRKKPRKNRNLKAKSLHKQYSINNGLRLNTVSSKR